MTSFSVQKRASEHIAQAVPWSIKNLTAFGVAKSRSAALISETAKTSSMVSKEYLVHPNPSLR